MEQSITDLRQQRLQNLYDDCQQQVLSQILGPFGLSTAMFEDRNGGNVTTVKNFSREDDGFIADKDKASFEQSRKSHTANEINPKKTNYDRKDYSVADFDDRSKRIRSAGVDSYTSQVTAPEDMDADHVTSLLDISKNKKAHLALEAGTGLDKMKNMANSDENLAATHKSINRSKKAKRADKFADSEEAKKYHLNDKAVEEAQARSDQHINSTIDEALLQKQIEELKETSHQQALQMGLRQALGVLLTELVNGLFNEFKVLIKHGVEAGKTLFEEIHQRLGRIIASVVKKIPDAVSQMFQGGISGFMSNLLTFVLNSFLSTAKRFVTAIREGLLGLFKAFRMIFFPPKGMTQQQAMQAGLKILTTVVVSTIGILLQESVATFVATVPFLKPVADIVTPVLIGTMTGLLSAFLAYQIDCMFDRFLHSNDERLMDELMADVKRRDEFANELVKLSDNSLENISNYSKSITVYQSIGNSLGAAGLAANATLFSLEATVTETREQVAKSREMIGFINSSQLEIENFLKTI